MSGSMPSPFAPTNDLYDAAKVAQNVQSYQDNQLLMQQHQQAIGTNEIEMMARAAGSLMDPNLYPTPEARAAAYPVRLAALQAQGFAKNAPATYPGDTTMRALAQMGTSSTDLYKLGQAGTAIPTPGFNTGAAAPAAGGGTAAAPGDGLTGDREHDRALIVARESGGDPTALNYVAKADPTAYARGATASGKYQFVNSTWREGMQLAGLDPAKYPTAREAPEAVQDQVFNAVYGKYGAAPWQKGSKDWIRDEQGQYQLATVRPTATPAPPGGGVVARNPGAVQVAGPGAGTPPAAPTAPPDLTGPRPLPPTGPGAPVVTPQQLANTPTNQVMPGAPNGPPAVAPPPAQAPASPAPQPPAATAPAQVAPVAVPAPQPMDEHNLTRQDYQDLDREKRSGMSGPQLDQSVQQRQNANLARQEKYRADVRQAQNDAQAQQKEAQAAQHQALEERRQAAQDDITAAKWKAEQDKTARDVDNPFGDSESGKLRYILSNPASDPKSPTYHAAWAAYANPQTVNGVTMPGHVMTPFRMPVDTDGVPVTTYDKPAMTLAPGDLTQYRKITEQSGTLLAALDEFSKAAKDASLTERIKTVAGGATDLRSAWTNLAMLAKGDALYQLGVLSGPDMSVIRGALADPSTFMGSVASTDTIDKQVGRIKRILATRLDQARESYLPGAKTETKETPTTTTAPSNTAPTQTFHYDHAGNRITP